MMPNFGDMNSSGPAGPSKTALRRMIEEALANTVALQDGRPLVAPKLVRATPVPKGTKIAPAAPVEALVHVSREPKEPTPSPPVPTADQVAHAIVAACLETGASPLEINGAPGVAVVHARYYAMYAIEHCFPGLSGRSYGAMVGAGKNFYAASKQSVIQMVSPNRRRAAWWNEAAYARVIKAIQP